MAGLLLRKIPQFGYLQRTVRHWPETYHSYWVRG